MDGEDVGDGLVLGQHLLELGEVGRRVFGRFVHGNCTAGDLGYFPCPLTIRAVDQYQELAHLRHEARDHRLDSKRARALHRHGDVGALGAGQLDDLVQHHAVDAQEFRVARTPVVDHRLLDGSRRGQRTGGEQKRVAGFRGGGLGGGHGGMIDSQGRSVQCGVKELSKNFDRWSVKRRVL